MADSHHSSNNRLSVDNRFAMIPHWVIMANISDGALRLYAVLMKYADGQTRTAFPSRSTLARDIRKSPDTVDRYIKELEKVGALRVRRRVKDSKENWSNLYTVVTANPDGAVQMRPPTRMDAAENYNHLTTPTSVSRPTSSSSPVAPSPQAATAHDEQQPAAAQTVPSPIQEIGDEDIKNQLLDIAVRASADWQHYLNEDIPADRFEPPESIDVLEQSLNNLYDDVDRIIGDDICNKGWDDRLAKLIAQKPDRPRWGAAVWVNTYINWARLQD